MSDIDLELYLDTYEGIDFDGFITATNKPGVKPNSFRRYRILVSIPDPNEPDETVGSMVEEIQDE